MAIHVGIIDQDPVRLVTPLLDHRTVSRHIIFIGDHTQTVIYQRLSDVLNKRNISTDFFEIPVSYQTPLPSKVRFENLPKHLKRVVKRSNSTPVVGYATACCRLTKCFAATTGQFLS